MYYPSKVELGDPEDARAEREVHARVPSDVYLRGGDMYVVVRPTCRTSAGDW